MSEAKKTLDNENQSQTVQQVSDVKIVGNTDLFQLISKASSKEQGWMKSTKAMEIESIGCVVQVTTQQGDNVAEALVFVPGVKIWRGEDGNLKLVGLGMKSCC